MKAIMIGLGLALAVPAVATAQLPPDAVSLQRLKIPEAIKSADLCPVHLLPADPAVPKWTHNGVEYGGDTAACQAEFAKDPDTWAAKAAEERFVQNFVKAMSTVWCPVTDEITPGGLTQWEVEGVVWESCCDFCDDTVQDGDFISARERLIERARKTYALTGGTYNDTASSPLEGAVDFGQGFPDEAQASGSASAPGEAAAPTASTSLPEAAAWMSGQELKATWTGGVGKLFEQRCVECHRPGGAAPMSFATYGGIRSWIKSMKQSVESRGMPPWPADPHVAAYENSRYLTPAEMNLFLEWANAGYPAGEGEFIPAAPQAEWNIGEPDHVFEIPEYTLGSDETAVVKEVQVATGFPEDRWIATAEAIPGDIYTVLQVDGGPLGSFYPGNSQDVYPAAAPRLLKAGETVTVRLLNVKEAGYELPIAPTRLGVVFVDDPSVAKAPAQVAPIANADFTIPAGADSFEASATFEFPSDGTIYSFRPVLNQRGKSVRLTAELPDGSKRDLLNIPRWDPAWKIRYRLAEPLEVPEGTVVRLTGVYDNSTLNAKNPNAAIDVAAGPGGEALEGWLVYAAK